MRIPDDKHRDDVTHALVHHDGEWQDITLGDTLTLLAEQIAGALDCSECCIYEHLPDREALRAQALWSRRLTQRDRDWIGETHSLAEIPDFERVVKRAEVVVSYPDNEAGSELSGFESMAYWGELAAIWSPITFRREVLGILELTEKETPRQFDAKDVRAVGRLASLAGIALHNARASRAAEERNRQLTALIDASRAMVSTLDPGKVFAIVCRQAALALGTGSSYIYLYDREDRTMAWLAEYQTDASHTFDEPLGTVYPIDEYPQQRAVVETRLPVEARTDDPDLDPVARENLVDWEEQSSLMVPLLVGGEVIAAFEVCEPAYPRHFTEQETALCVALGEQAAVAMHNAQLYQRLTEQKVTIERQAMMDSLTGLYNHRYFWERLRNEVARAHRYGQPLSLLMLDLDDFKLVNDRYGHPAGDELLRTVGRALQTQIRQGIDCPARYGGEEFMIILPSTESELESGTLDGAVTTAERIRNTLAGLRAPVADEAWAGITTSIGIATLPIHAQDAEELVAQADRALYAAKRLGKDRVAVAGAG
jgi:diguanylate cyclase (GGDEF)-like protein